LNGVDKVKIRTILALSLVAMFVIPGSASQFAATAAPAANRAEGSTDGLFNDPDATPRLSITLPTHFTALNTSGDPLSHFGG
jgi:hypothetical protein